ncbi:hypothetical protein YPPY54_0154, partial [Yersinia pestis PY-54]|jgi:hypothetical protein
MDWI